MNMRDNGIYWYTNKNGENIYPYSSFTKKEAQEFLLFSIESFDDNLVGYTKESIKDSYVTDEIFEKIAREYKDNL